jgi:hypothetical protein
MGGFDTRHGHLTTHEYLAIELEVSPGDTMVLAAPPEEVIIGLRRA